MGLPIVSNNVKAANSSGEGGAPAIDMLIATGTNVSDAF